MNLGLIVLRRTAAVIATAAIAAWPGLALAGPGQPPSPEPQITSISPIHGAPGQAVTLHGSGFLGVREVAFGDQPVDINPPSFGGGGGGGSTSDTTIVLQAPTGFNPGTSVQVGIPGTGAVAPQPFTYDIAFLSVTGPLPGYSDCVGCSDPWPQNHTIDAPGPLYSAQANYPQNAPHDTIAVVSPTPTFYFTLQFDASGQTPGATSWNGEPVVQRGSWAYFSVSLDTCSAPAPPGPPPPNPDCTDFAGNAGNWRPVKGGSTDVVQPWSGKSPVIPLSLRDSDRLDLAGLNLARTYRLKLEVALEQMPLGAAAIVGENTRASDTEYSSPFDVSLAPSALYQVDVLPYTIVYAPPGDQSSQDYTLSTSYGTTLMVGASTNQTNNMTNEQDSSVKASMQATFGVPLFTSAQIDISGTMNWDTSTSYGFGRTAMSQEQQGTTETFSDDLGGPAPDPSQVPGDGQVCAVKSGPGGLPAPDCTQTSQAPNADYWHEPFWRDTFYLLVHPQFAAWSYNGQERDVLLGAVPGLVSIDVAHLALCAQGVPADPAGVPPCQLNFTDVTLTGAGYTSHNVSATLSADEAANLLQLDPFYSGGGQAAPLDPKRFTPVSGAGGTLHYGAYESTDTLGGDVPPQSQTTKFGLNNTSQVETGGSSTFTSTVTDTVGSEVSVGGQLNAGSCATGNCASVGISYTTGESQKTQQQLQVTYQDSTATAETDATQTNATLNDIDNIDLASNGSPACPKTCHAPLLHQPTVAVYLDNMFGGYAFQDPAAPAAPVHLRPLMPVGSGSGSGSGPSQILHLLPGDISNITSVLRQLIGQGSGSGQTQGSGGPQGAGRQASGGEGQFSDVPAGYWAASSIQALVSKGIASGFPDGTFRPDATLTRAQFVKLLVLTLGLKTGGGGATPFTDVSSSDWFAPYVSAAVQAGLAQGVSPTAFDPDGTVTREQMAVLLARALKLNGQAALQFTDGSVVDGWAAQAVRAVVSAGYLSGFPDGSFQPRGATTRAQAAKVLALALTSGAAPGPAASGSP